MNERESKGLRLLITIFGIFFGGWWTNYLSEIFISSNVPMLNKWASVVYILIIFISFYLVLYVDWWVLTLIFSCFDIMIILTTVLTLFSPDTMIQGETYNLKFCMAMISMGILQFLIIHYSKLSRRKEEKNDKPTDK